MFSKESPIGIIDSGIGGFSGAREGQKKKKPRHINLKMQEMRRYFSYVYLR